MTKNKHKGSTFESFLEDEDLLDSSDAVAIKRVIAFELIKNMKKHHCSKIEMANKMHTSRSALDRLLDPDNTSVTLNTLVKAAHFLGKKLCITLQ
jgi:hypothetical protein